uniref:Uncharacterized protein n=1 Tax=Anopheles culicifacies TaxID=139723 RepID=A0A182LYM7_9DIPT
MDHNILDRVDGVVFRARNVGSSHLHRLGEWRRVAYTVSSRKNPALVQDAATARMSTGGTTQGYYEREVFDRRIRTIDDLTMIDRISYSTGVGETQPEISVKFPIYECDERSRDWTVRCLVPLTNAQMSVDLCKTGENPDQQFLNRCAKELQVLGLSCPQPVAVADIAKNMQVHKPPPMASYESPNLPKVPKPPSTSYRKDKFSL